MVIVIQYSLLFSPSLSLFQPFSLNFSLFFSLVSLFLSPPLFLCLSLFIFFSPLSLLFFSPTLSLYLPLFLSLSLSLSLSYSSLLSLSFSPSLSLSLSPSRIYIKAHRDPLSVILYIVISSIRACSVWISWGAQQCHLAIKIRITRPASNL